MQRNLIANAKNNYISNRLRLAPSSARLWSELHSLGLVNFKDLKPEISLDQLNLFFTSFHFLASLLLHSLHNHSAIHFMFRPALSAFPSSIFCSSSIAEPDTFYFLHITLSDLILLFESALLTDLIV